MRTFVIAGFFAVWTGLTLFVGELLGYEYMRLFLRMMLFQDTNGFVSFQLFLVISAVIGAFVLHYVVERYFPESTAAEEAARIAEVFE